MQLFSAKETLGENYSEDNPYRILVDKYEALLKIQQKHNAFTPMVPSAANANNNNAGNNKDRGGISLHEELQMSGQFSSFNGNASDSDDSSDDGCPPADNKGRAAQGTMMGGTKYSETETTSSSGFSDETSNKCTQTETFFTGSFLCTISDGDDCRFSIYDDASPVESRFRKTPEYRQLFREIFAVLKRAAEAKDEGERLPLLQDDDHDRGYEGEDGLDGDDDAATDTPTCGRSSASVAGTPRVPPATPACEHNPLMATIESETVERRPTTPPPKQQQRVDGDQQQPPAAVVEQQQQQPQQQEPRRRRRDIIEELAATVKHKKHVRHRKSTAASQQQTRDISHLLEFKWTDQVTRRQPRSGSGDRPPSSHRSTWCAAAPNDGAEASPAVAQPYASAASQEVAKLKLLDKSYAEVLRLRKVPPTSSKRPQSQYLH